MKVTILGCGASGGVPRLGNQWGQCDPENPRNRRNRSSIFVENGSTGVLIDSGPDLRQQSLAAEISHFDGVIYTHDHADHVHGIDELRVVARSTGQPVDIYASQDTLDSLSLRFPYAFGQESKWYPAFVRPHAINGTFVVGEVPVQPFEQVHGQAPSLGFRFGQIAYSTDLVDLPEASFAALEDVDTWIVAVLARFEHPLHANLDTVLEWIERLSPRRAILTHMTASLDYAELCATLPSGVEPAYDGMVIEVKS
ncbi:MAG: MBL fold metallo-hydrolase [Alphaproteobacteria bacterium]|nr:MBL fold metallo-hydrolase [Rhodospirillaceae bacterium]MDP6406552.1 MBL fold metallo-hydrolase [Alphaproteobacteria bacterium]MDP6623567.1 MBL fold metallo-hydrolase [Alphaproteobacteria bacterium]